jgi:hypothetical protein
MKRAWFDRKGPPFWTFGFNPRWGNRRVFVCYFHYTGWQNVQLGVSLDVRTPNLEIHLPSGFVRIGWSMTREMDEAYRSGKVQRAELVLLPHK